MKYFIRLLGIWLLLAAASVTWAQPVGPKVDRIDIKYVGPASVSEPYIRANIRTKVGDTYQPDSTQDDIQSLYSTGKFYNIQIAVAQADDGGVILTYVVQPFPRITEITLSGNKKVSDSKLKKKITVKVGDPLDEQKLFSDVQAMKTLYQKYGYPNTQIRYVPSIDENAGAATVVFQIQESLKVKITDIDFIGATAYPQGKLRKQIKTREHWMFSWITGSGVFKQDEFDDDKDALTTFYRDHGYLDFEIKDVKFVHPTPNTMQIHFYVYEGRQYRVGSVKFTGNQIFNDATLIKGLRGVQSSRVSLGAHNLPMDVGDVFTADGLQKDTQAIEDFYGTRGYVDVAQGQNLQVSRIPNVDTGTMDLVFQVEEGEKSYVEKINIQGNLKTKDKVIRRELAIAPGDVFDMVRVKISQQRLEGLGYFDKVNMEPVPTDPPIAGHKDLDVNVIEKNTGNLTFGAGFSSVDSVVGFVELTQGNFDLFNPPNFTGAGQKFRLMVQIGSERQDYEMSFIEPWFLNRKLSLGVDLYRHELDFESPNNIFDETRTGARLSLTRALWSDFLIGSVSYTVEDVGISLNDGFHGPETLNGSIFGIPMQSQQNVPSAILEQVGDHFYQRFGTTLAYDTRNSTQLPNHGQRTEVDTTLSVGDTTYYKLDASSDWFFPGLFKGHVLEVGGKVGVADSLQGGDVPFYDRYYLGGLYTLRGFKYRNIAPRDPTYNNPMDPNPNMPNEPIGGDSYWYGSLEYSIPILEKENGVGIRIAAFYDIGAVSGPAYNFSGDYDDNWGLGLRLNIPHLGPLRLDYGIPIHHDQYNSGSGQFQFGVGYTRGF